MTDAGWPPKSQALERQLRTRDPRWTRKSLYSYNKLGQLVTEDKPVSGVSKPRMSSYDAERGGSSPLLVPFAIDVCDRLLCVQAELEQSNVYIVEFEEGEISEYRAYRTDVTFGEFLASLEPDAEQPDYIEQLAQRPWKEVEALIVRGGDINAVSATGLTLLCEAIRAENHGLVGYLLCNGANLQGAMEVAVQNCDITAIRELLSVGANPNEGLEFAVGIRRKQIRDLLSAANRTDPR